MAAVDATRPSNCYHVTHYNLSPRDLVKNKEIGQDDEKKGIEQIQTFTDQHTAEIDALIKEKEVEIMEV